MSALSKLLSRLPRRLPVLACAFPTGERQALLTAGGGGLRAPAAGRNYSSIAQVRSSPDDGGDGGGSRRRRAGGGGGGTTALAAGAAVLAGAAAFLADGPRRLRAAEKFTDDGGGGGDDGKDGNSRRHRFNFIADVVSETAPALVYIEIKDTGVRDYFTGQPVTSSNGSGFIVKEDGLILTNAHVVINKPRASIQVRLQDGRTFSGTVEDVDTRSDLATVRIQA